MSRAGMLAAAVFAALTTIAASGSAVEFEVNSSADPGDGVCDGTCTLRDAILAANAAGGSRAITFDPDVFPHAPANPIVLASELPYLVGSKLRIDGSGAHVRVDASAAGAGVSALVVHSGDGQPLSDVVVRRIALLGADGFGLAVCAGSFLAFCEESLSKLRIEKVGSFANAAAGIILVGQSLSGVTVSDNTAAENGFHGIRVQASDELSKAALVGNSLPHNDGAGLFVTTEGVASKVKIVENQVQRSQGVGIWLRADAMQGISVASNRVAESGEAGIRVGSEATSKLTVVDNAISDSGQDGILLELEGSSSKVRVERNRVTVSFGEAGLLVRTTTLSKGKIARNTASQSAGSGIGLHCLDEASGVAIEGNVALDNDAAGLFAIASQASKKTRLARNTADGNGGAGIHIRVSQASVEANAVRGNNIGIRVDDPVADASVRKNRAFGNERAGIIVLQGTTGVRVESNAAWGNAWGALPFADLAENTIAGCVASWQKNDFGSATDPSCIR